HLWKMAGLGAKDVDVVQSYENFTGGVLMSLVEHGFFAPEEANEFLTFDNLIAPRGRLPLNTSGGNLAECYMHGLELQIEAVRQLRGQSTSQVADAEVSMVISGPMVTPVSSMIMGAESTLCAICPQACRRRCRRMTVSTNPTGKPRAAASCWSSAARAAAPSSGDRNGSATSATGSTSTGTRCRARAAAIAGNGHG